MIEPAQATLTDKELMDKLAHQGAMWFNNTNLLLLNELFRRYERCKRSHDTNLSLVNSPSAE